MSSLDGVDTSHWNTLNGQALPPLKFATHKASEGLFVDSTLAQFLNFYRKTIPITGAYHFLSPGISAAEQFTVFSQACARVGGCDIYQIDWEATQRGGVNLYPDLATVYEFEDRCLQAWGHKVVTYSAPWVEGFSEWLARPGRSPLWLADYVNGPANAQRLRAVLLQYSSKVTVTGFVDPVDGNTIINQTAWAILSGAHTPIIEPPPVVVTPITPSGHIKENDMIIIYTVDDANGKGIWLFSATGLIHVGNVELIDQLRAVGVPTLSWNQHMLDIACDQFGQPHI